jgi:hypothetical protein
VVKAVYRKGHIQLLEAPPVDWREGEELLIDAVTGDNVPFESFEQWQADMDAATADLTDEDHEQLMKALADVEAESKELGRREMERADQLFSDEEDAPGSKESA